MSDDEIIDLATEKLQWWQGSIYPFARAIIAQARAEFRAEMEPVAWVRRHPDGALTAEFLEHEVIEPVRKQSGAWLPLAIIPDTKE